MLVLLLGAFGIAFAPIFVRLSEVGPMATAFWRVALALPVLWLWMRASPPGAATRADAWPDRLKLMATGLLFAGDLTAWHWSIAYTSVANSTVLANFAPIFVTFGAWVFYGERSSGIFILGLVLALAGAGVLLGKSLTIGPEHVWGDLLGLITAVFYGAYILAVSRMRNRYTTATIVAWSALGTTLGLVPVTVVFGESWLPQTAWGWGIVLGLAWVSHAGGQSLIAYALAHLPPAFSAVSLLSQPVIAAMLAWILLGESLGLEQALGALLILAGIVLARVGSLHRPLARRGQAG